jgi:hypothetical protein
MVDDLRNRNLTIRVVQFGPLSHPNNNEEELIMKIMRNFEGTSLEINLTEEECKKIYDEIQFQKDMAEVDDAIAVTCQYNDIPEDVIKDRFDRLLALVQKHGHEKVKALEGTVQKVLVEEVNEQDSTLVSGKLTNNVTVHFPGDESLIGKIVEVRLNCCKGFYFIGEMI